MPRQWKSGDGKARKCARCGHEADKLAYIYPDPEQNQEWVGRLVCADKCAPVLRARLVERGILKGAK